MGRVQRHRRHRKKGPKTVCSNRPPIITVLNLGGDTIFQSHVPLTLAALRRLIETHAGISQYRQLLCRRAPLKNGRPPREDDDKPGELIDDAEALSYGDTIVMMVMPTSWQKYPADLVTVSEGNQLVTQKVDGQWSLVTLGERHINSKHYWEFALVGGCLHVGVYGANTDLRGFSAYAPTTWCIFTSDGSLLGGGIFRGASRAFTPDECNSKGFRTGYKSGDRIGVLLNLDDGSLLFFKNGVKHGPGFPAGSVKGPVTVGAQMCWADEGTPSALKVVSFPNWPPGYT